MSFENESYSCLVLRITVAGISRDRPEAGCDTWWFHGGILAVGGHSVSLSDKAVQEGAQPTWLDNTAISFMRQ